MLAQRVRQGSSDAGEREARRAAAASVRNEAVGPLGAAQSENGAVPSHVEETVRSPGEALDERLRTTFEPRFGHDFGRVRVHSDERAASSAGQLHARAYAFGQDLVFGRNRYDPGSLPGRTLIAHELAHVVQQGRAGSRSLQLDSELERFPEEERKKVRVTTGDLSVAAQAWADALFRSGRETPIPAERTIQLGASVPQKAHQGLRSVAESLTSIPEGRPNAFLPRNTAVSLAIPAAERIYRFTRLDRPSTAAAGVRGPTPEVVLVEEIGVIPPSLEPIQNELAEHFSGPLRPPPPRLPDECTEGTNPDSCHRVIVGQRRPGERPTPVALKPDKAIIRKVPVQRGPGWTDVDWNAAVAALETLPDSALKQAAGVKFLRLPKEVCKADEPKEVCDPEEPATTNAVDKTLTLFDTAFSESTTRFGTATWLQEVILHEVGHIADYKPLESALGGTEAEQLAARSRSGSAWVKHTRPGRRDLLWYTEIGGGATKDSFREAALKDGLTVENDNKKIVSGAVTKYGLTSWRELFADSFALYMNDPDLLKAIRPNTYAYLVKAFPR